MINNPIIFYIASLLLLIFLSFSLFCKNIIYSLLSAIFVFLLVALFFYMLGSEYNAIIQASVYGFAVPVILGISIMFANNKKENYKIHTLPYLSITFAGIFILAFVYLMKISLALNPETFAEDTTSVLSYYDVLSAFAKGIFIKYVWAFELLSLLLTVAVAGIAMLRRRGA